MSLSLRVILADSYDQSTWKGGTFSLWPREEGHHLTHLSCARIIRTYNVFVDELMIILKEYLIHMQGQRLN